MEPPIDLAEGVPLAPLTTLEVGGPARYLARCADPEALEAALAWAAGRRLPTLVLGGGSNLLVADGGFDGLVIQPTDGSLSWQREGGSVVARAAAGVEWDRLVAAAVADGLAGLECLSGIPGWVGAAPIQNVGAYGQELAQVVDAVEVVARRGGGRRTLRAAQCGFGYRSSRFKEGWRERYVVAAVALRLRRDGRGTVLHPELRRRLGLPAAGGAAPDVDAVRREVLALRAAKSMLHDRSDPNHRSAGSFFVNPVVAPALAEAVRARAGVAPEELPSYPAPGGVKLSAAWLIERAGFPRGLRRGRVGLSSRHALALVNLGGATAAALVQLAGEVRRGVAERFGVVLDPEPAFVGFGAGVDALLGGVPVGRR